MSGRANGTSSSHSTEDKERAATEAAEKSAIVEFKRAGDFDHIRKETLRQWQASDDGTAFQDKLKGIVESEVERDRSLLARDRGKAATLLGGAVERTQLYPEARLAAAKNIFQTEEFKKRIYDSMKKYFPKPEAELNKDETMTENSEGQAGVAKSTVSAQDAALAFISREQQGT